MYAADLYTRYDSLVSRANNFAPQIVVDVHSW